MIAVCVYIHVPLPDLLDLRFQPSMTLVSTVPGDARMSLSPQEPSPSNMSSPQEPAAAPGSDVTSPGIDERGRGRRRSRNVGRTDENGDGGTMQSPQGDPSVDDPPRKRRRSRKGLDKKFECNHPDCGKSYSRAEHLYRHQLNRESGFPTSAISADWIHC